VRNKGFANNIRKRQYNHFAFNSPNNKNIRGS